MSREEKLLKCQIDELKKELYDQIKKENYTNLSRGHVLEISKEIDDLMNIYLKIK